MDRYFAYLLIVFSKHTASEPNYKIKTLNLLQFFWTKIFQIHMTLRYNDLSPYAPYISK